MPTELLHQIGNTLACVAPMGALPPIQEAAFLMGAGFLIATILMSITRNKL